MSAWKIIKRINKNIKKLKNKNTPRKNCSTFQGSDVDAQHQIQYETHALDDSNSDVVYGNGG